MPKALKQQESRRRPRGRTQKVKIEHHAKVVIYARFSPRPDAEECDSCDKQIARAKEYCERRGWLWAESRIYRDDDESGGDWDRPEIWNAINATKRGMVLLVTCWDRLARDTQFTLMVNEDLRRRGAVLYSGQEGPFDDEDNPAIKLTSTLLAAVAEYVRRIIAAKTRAAMRRHVRNGRVMSRELPIGFEYDPDSPKHEDSGLPTRMRTNDQEEGQVQRILELRKRRWSLRKIARYMNDYDRPIRGHTWSHRTVSRVLAFRGVR